MEEKPWGMRFNPPVFSYHMVPFLEILKDAYRCNVFDLE